MTFEELWENNRSGLSRFIRWRVRNATDAEDVLQDVSIKALRGFHQLEDASRARVWLFQIARNAIADAHRKARAKTPVHPDDLWYGQKLDSDFRCELERCIEPILNALPHEVGRTLRATHLESQPQRAFAAAEGLSYTATKSRVQRARAALRSAFEACCDLAFDRRGMLSDCNYRPGVAKKC